jgi:[protein-PII] uridylyltransferase
VFEVHHAARREPDWAALEARVARGLDDPGFLEALIAEQTPGRLPARPGAAKVASPRVIFDNDATPRATIVEVRAPDGPGVLWRIARAIAQNECDIGIVRALTMGHEVVDTFYVTKGETGGKLEDVDTRRVEDAIVQELT